ncbi:helix-turn-helix transcriptional regulator [Nocardioides mangrovi]|uniref:WYL domain-containing protein n=1 Tax=Nocardioides mangrovi TaxID=2874580 RepID=A0ABS7UFS3_9ACTN|nr:WYL domain-containing protein [Nocardioides mangrovi]MBZ5739868.1 WYL domain-containing protein [Nocardioides mangrovi]
MSTTSGPGAKDQVARLLTLVPFLHSHGSARLEDAARTLGIPPEQVLADLKVLLMCGLPGGYPDDLIDVDLDALEGPDGLASDGVIRVTNADYLARPLRLTPTEATAIIVALRALRESAGAETREIVDRALAKLEAAAAGGPPVPHVDPGAPPGGVDLLRLESDLRRAADERRQVRLTYYVPSRDEQSERVVDPRGIVSAHGFTYLDAWCHSAEAPRLFRLDRIADATVLDSAIATEPAAPREVGETGLFPRSPESTVVTLELDPAARWVVEYYPVDAVRSRRGGRLEVDLVVANERWLQRLLLRLSPHVRVVAPGEYADALSETARRTLSLYT